MAKKKPLRIGITLGDVNGIGPEVALKAARRLRRVNAQLVFIGNAANLEQQAIALKLSALRMGSPTTRPPRARIAGHPTNKNCAGSPASWTPPHPQRRQAGFSPVLMPACTENWMQLSLRRFPRRALIARELMCPATRNCWPIYAAQRAWE
ncbi:MAG: hypothetical protein M5U15_06055 [Kiritimatiellae bacterium]|nr:hypothetical protein [Kiritimatiellia bacterium]